VFSHACMNWASNGCSGTGACEVLFFGCRSPKLGRVRCQAKSRRGLPSVGFEDQRFIAEINQHRMVLESNQRQKTSKLRS